MSAEPWPPAWLVAAADQVEAAERHDQAELEDDTDDQVDD